MFVVNAYFSDQFSLALIVILAYIYYEPGPVPSAFHKLYHAIVPKLL